MSPTERSPSGSRGRRLVQVALVATTWAVVALVWVRVQRSTGDGPVGTLQRAIDVARGSWWAVLAYLVVGRRVAVKREALEDHWR